jgi:hypothetical protein
MVYNKVKFHVMGSQTMAVPKSVPVNAAPGFPFES